MVGVSEASSEVTGDGVEVCGRIVLCGSCVCMQFCGSVCVGGCVDGVGAVIVVRLSFIRSDSSVLAHLLARFVW